MRSMSFALLISIALTLVSVDTRAGESCFYPDRRDEGGIVAHHDCGDIKGDAFHMGRPHLDHVAFDKEGLACVITSQQSAFYLHRNGKSQRVYFYDNGCDYFEHDLARGLVGKHTVFVDKQLNRVLDTRFEWAESFDYGHTVVCNGPFGESTVGEHTLLTGGRCGLMNRQGTLVVEATYAIGERTAFDTYLNSHNHCAPPPITSEGAALCHARRHVANMEFYTGEWSQYSIVKRAGEWLVTFREKNDDETMLLTLKADTAQWSSLVPQP